MQKNQAARHAVSESERQARIDALLVYMHLPDFPRDVNGDADPYVVARLCNVPLSCIGFPVGRQHWGENEWSQIVVTNRFGYLNIRQGLSAEHERYVIFRSLASLFDNVLVLPFSHRSRLAPLKESDRHLGLADRYRPFSVIFSYPFASNDVVYGLDYLQGKVLYPPRATPYVGSCGV